MNSDANDDAASTADREATVHPIDWSRPDPVSSAVVEAVVSKTGTDAVSLPPLATVVDGDALNRLFTRATDGELSFEYAGLAVVVSTVDGVTVGRADPLHKTQDGSVVTPDMDEPVSRPAEGQRVRTTLDGEDVQGTVASVTYTPKKGNLVAKVTLDEPGPDGRDALAVAVEDLDRLD